MLRKIEPALRYALQFRNGVWQIWDRQHARVVQAFSMAEAAVEHHNKFAPKGEALDVRGLAVVALARMSQLRDELHAAQNRKAQRGAR